MKYRLFLLIILLISFLNTVQAQEGDFSADTVLDLPRDHLLHSDDPIFNENYVEWLYFTGIFTDETTAVQWGYQVTLFTRKIGGAQVFLYDVALSDIQNSRFLSYRGIGGNQEVRVEDEIFRDDFFTLALINEVWEITFDGEVEHLATGEKFPLKLNLTLSDEVGDYTLHSDDGINVMGTCAADIATLDGWSYYYSHPSLTTSGVILLDGQRMNPTGETWFDHQWGNFAQCELAWNWFSLRLDDGSDMMLFQLLDENGVPLPEIMGATYMQPDGSVEFWTENTDLVLTPTRFWKNPQTGYTFALGWQLDTPIGSFGIAPVFDDQTPPMTAGLPYYWEGVITIREGSLAGQQVGLGYLEVVPARSEAE